MRFASACVLQHLEAVPRDLNSAHRGLGISLARVDHRQAPRHAAGRARLAVAAVAKAA